MVSASRFKCDVTTSGGRPLSQLSLEPRVCEAPRFTFQQLWASDGAAAQTPHRSPGFTVPRNFRRP